MLDKTISFARRNVVALLALFVALGGTAYAANQIGSGQIKDDSVKSVDIKDDSIRGGDIDDHAVGLDQLKQSVYPVSSALVIADEDTDADLVNADGFTEVEHLGTGEYVMTFADSNPVCNVVLSPNGPTGAPMADLAQADAIGQTLKVAIIDDAGNPVDLGEGAGFFGFDIIGTC